MWHINHTKIPFSFNIPEFKLCRKCAMQLDELKWDFCGGTVFVARAYDAEVWQYDTVHGRRYTVSKSAELDATWFGLDAIEAQAILYHLKEQYDATQ